MSDAQTRSPASGTRPRRRTGASDAEVIARVQSLADTLSRTLGRSIRVTGAGGQDGVGESSDLAIAVRVGRRTVAALVVDQAIAEEPTGPHQIVLLRSMAELLGNNIEQEGQLLRRVAELQAVADISTTLTGVGSLQELVEKALRTVIDVMGVKAGSIRLLKDDSDELVLMSYVNLSARYFDKGSIFAHESELDMQSLSGEVVYVEDLAGDPRVRFPDLVEQEGLKSFIATGIIFRGRPIGVMRLYTGEPRRFSVFARGIFRIAAQQVGTAIASSRLVEEQRAARQVKRQLQLGAEVQRNLLPQRMPALPGLDIAARCVTSLDLGGDFFDFLGLGSSIGVVIGDVAGKGLPAALLMASVRATLRAHAADLYDIGDVMSKTNRALTRDTREHEFATLWYGIVDPATLRLTYSNAGHEPALVWRPIGHEVGSGTFHRLASGGMVMGVDGGQKYEHGLFDFEPGDILLAFSDGLTEARSYEGAVFGRAGIENAVRTALGQDGKASAEAIANHILWEVRRFAGFNLRGDDMTLVVMRVLNAVPSKV